MAKNKKNLRMKVRSVSLFLFKLVRTEWSFMAMITPLTLAIHRLVVKLCFYVHFVCMFCFMYLLIYLCGRKPRKNSMEILN